MFYPVHAWLPFFHSKICIQMKNNNEWIFLKFGNKNCSILQKIYHPILHLFTCKLLTEPLAYQPIFDTYSVYWYWVCKHWYRIINIKYAGILKFAYRYAYAKQFLAEYLAAKTFNTFKTFNTKNRLHQKPLTPLQLNL